MKRTIDVLNSLVSDGVICDYAIGGAMGATFYIEPVLTIDLDIFVVFQDETTLDPIAPIYAHLRERGYLPSEIHRECVDIEGVPVQFLPAYNALLVDAVAEARSVDYLGAATKTLSAEYLSAIALQTGRDKDRLRVRAFCETATLDEIVLQKILTKHNLVDKWNQWTK